jgi:light-regulated signal transduction histidine kinase (bacteriophytochrome)
VIDPNTLEFCSAVMAAIPDVIFEVDQEGKFTFYHTQPEQMNIDPTTIIGASVNDVYPAATATLILQAVRRAVEQGQPQKIKYSLSTNGETKFYQAHFGPAPLRGTVVAIVRDITIEAQHERELSEQKRCLEEANVSLEQFVYLASHDLREPLSGVAGYATLLQKRYSYLLDMHGRHFVDMVVEGTKNMEVKIDGLLTLSRINKGTLSGVFSLGSAIESARRCLVGPLQKVDVEFCHTASLPMIRGDRGQITQVFQNLFSNSIKYRNDNDKVIIEIDVTDHHDQPGMLLVSVKDNGIGFDMKYAERIFGVFQRLYTVQQYPGTGIGLAIVKKIIERHGGQVWALSEPNKGATFFFTIPKAA